MSGDATAEQTHVTGAMCVLSGMESDTASPVQSRQAINSLHQCSMFERNHEGYLPDLDEMCYEKSTIRTVGRVSLWSVSLQYHHTKVKWDFKNLSARRNKHEIYTSLRSNTAI